MLLRQVSYTYFNPLPSHEGRLLNSQFIIKSVSFQSTPLTRGETKPFGDIPIID